MSARTPSTSQILEEWLQSYRPQELFDESGGLRAPLRALAPTGNRRMSANPHANGGLLLQDLDLPDFRRYAVNVESPGMASVEPTRVLGNFLRDVIKANPTTFRIVGPDETISNRLSAVFEATDRVWEAETLPGDEFLASQGRVMEVLSEHLCEGWLEGYLLTGRHGLFNCYEAFIHIVDSMLNQHAKWLKTSKEIPWRRPIASLNYLLSSHVWRQDHNGFSHQDPGFIDHLVNKKPAIVRVYLPPDANTLLSVADHCLRSRDYVNLIVAGKQPALTYLTMDEAVDHCTRGLGIFEWASNDDGDLPDVVLGCAGDIPTLETLAAASILRDEIPELKVRVVNVVDLMRMSHETEHPHGLPEAEFDGLFTTDRPVIFAYHGYPWLIHRLAYRHTNHHNFHVRGYKEEGTTTTPFDMAMMNDMDRFHLVMDVIDRVPGLSERAAHVRQKMRMRGSRHVPTPASMARMIRRSPTGFGPDTTPLPAISQRPSNIPKCPSKGRVTPPKEERSRMRIVDISSGANLDSGRPGPSGGAITGARAARASCATTASRHDSKSRAHLPRRRVPARRVGENADAHRIRWDIRRRPPLRCRRKLSYRGHPPLDRQPTRPRTEAPTASFRRVSLARRRRSGSTIPTSR